MQTNPTETTVITQPGQLRMNPFDKMTAINPRVDEEEREERSEQYHDFLEKHNTILEEALDRHSEELRSSYFDTILKLAMAVEYKDKGTGAHLKRIALLTEELTRTMGMDPDFTERIYYASTMHDIGKVGIPDAVILKQGMLTPSEIRVMKTHTIIGGRILHGSRSPILKMAKDVALTHHERWDGTGYPKGLGGLDIPLTGRIVSIVDHYDAMRSVRSYKPRFSHSDVVKVITEGDGRTSPEHFDPDVFEAFIRAQRSLEEIYNNEFASTHKARAS